MVVLDEPDPEDVERAVETLELVLRLIDQDPVASGMKAMAEAAIGQNVGTGLVRWLRNPTEKREVRNAFIKRMREIWNMHPHNKLYIHQFLRHNRWNKR